MGKLVRNFYKLLMALSCLAMLVAFGTVMLGVAARELRWDIAGLDAYAGYAIAAALFLALPGTLQHGDHIRVTLLLDRVSPRVRGLLEWWSLGAGLALTAYVAWYAARLVWVSYSTHDISPAADASPLWIPQLAMALGCIGFALSFVQALVERWQGGIFIAVSSEAAHIE
ncbi:MAG: TRAP transporter small permease [Polaromonas sp.]|uniref:TRAP transporter small permease n=1 Tax=Polaromonas sp. TaxID=1869339 RepID=UPI00248828B8|nr:TRAP transporter small permease [Polaromonas sp.]MDI1238699.1 TRAP transporter small permease [Polaromonas sp.]